MISCDSLLKRNSQLCILHPKCQPVLKIDRQVKTYDKTRILMSVLLPTTAPTVVFGTNPTRVSVALYRSLKRQQSVRYM